MVISLDAQVEEARATRNAGKPVWAVAKRISERMVRKTHAVEAKKDEIAKLVAEAEATRLNIALATKNKEASQAQVDELLKELTLAQTAAASASAIVVPDGNPLAAWSAVGSTLPSSLNDDPEAVAAFQILECKSQPRRPTPLRKPRRLPRR